MKIVGISACPAGLAHTPMAAKALENAGKKLGYDVKIEQQGSLGQVNKISQAEVDEADFVLLATDQKVIDMDRFKDKPQLKVNISTCIKAPEAVLKKCVNIIESRK
ncbi:PTS fructose transporter subunit IIB [Gilliamella apicola]|uniref:PTS fructose transporter subunit IIB n=1 Tax=Gilliamella apicola TaxID=1196095 RepID=UPI003986AAB7